MEEQVNAYLGLIDEELGTSCGSGTNVCRDLAPVLEIAVNWNVQGILILISFFYADVENQSKIYQIGHNSHVIRAFMKTITVVYWKRML